MYPLTQNGKPDRRYVINLEFCGYEKPRHVLRYCGEFVASSISRASLIMRAAGHRSMAAGSPAIVAQETGAANGNG